MYLFPGPLGLWAGRLLGVVAAIDLFAMMMLTFVDVTGRKLVGTVAFAKPVYGAYEITELLMGVLIFSALPLVTAREGHVTIDIFDRLIPEGLRRAQRVIVLGISTIMLATIGWRLWLLSYAHAANNEVTMTLYIRHAPFSRLFAVMAIVAAIACAACVGYHLLRRANPNATTETGAAT